MSGSQKFFVCKSCGNVVGVVLQEGGSIACCGGNMTELVPNTVEASAEKHIPAVTVSGDVLNVTVGSVSHPMEADHNIKFVYVETQRGGQRKRLDVGAAPTATFHFSDDKPVAVYAYCNLHGLWKKEV